MNWARSRLHITRGSRSSGINRPPKESCTPKGSSAVSKLIRHNHNADRIDRRGFLECMAWAGTGVVWTITGGVLSSSLVSGEAIAKGGLHFVQISDSHIGFNKPANPDVERNPASGGRPDQRPAG